MEGLLFGVLFVIAMIFVVVVRTRLERKIAPYEGAAGKRTLLDK